ncbi:MAG TPA: helix-turn-helix domain-containing protein [Thermoplasmata archaeon]|nr:helix-turn-helix domain-containing protein [Thermoplasmata archaeon]
MPRLTDEIESPNDHTQEGLAILLGLSQESMSRILTRLVIAGLVSASRRHVPGRRLRVKTYDLTPAGARFLDELRRPSP